jgi:hypothetical protein
MDDLAKNFIYENLMPPYKIIRTTIIDLDFRELLLSNTKKSKFLDYLAIDFICKNLILPYKIIRTTIIDLDFGELRLIYS